MPHLRAVDAHRVIVLGAVEINTGAWVYRLGPHCADDFLALLEQVVAAFPAAPAIVMLSDNDRCLGERGFALQRW